MTFIFIPQVAHPPGLPNGVRNRSYRLPGNAKLLWHLCGSVCGYHAPKRFLGPLRM